VSRKKKVYKKHCEPDPIFQHLMLAKFINKVMRDGKKSIAQRIVYESLSKLSEKVKEDGVSAFEAIIKNIRPMMEVKSRRVGGSTYQVPVEVRVERSIALAMRWIINSARTRSGKSMIEKLSAELIDAYNRTGSSFKKREDTHKMAESNKAFAHFRW
jgi:small subunit ribosomal protein S7